MIDQLQEVFNHVTGRTDIYLTPKTKINESIGVSSFIKIQLICAVEEMFDVEVPNVLLKKMKTVEDIMNFLEDSKTTG